MSRLTKVDAEYPANKLTGAVFELYEDTDKDQKLTEKDELVGEIPEISEGIYQTDGLLYGGYFVKEKTARKALSWMRTPITLRSARTERL